MSTSMYAIVEVQHGRGGWHTSNRRPIYVEQNTDLFGALGWGNGVNKGLPRDASFFTTYATSLMVMDLPAEAANWELDRIVSTERANGWVAEGSATWVDGLHITDPDQQDHHAVTADEMDALILKGAAALNASRDALLMGWPWIDMITASCREAERQGWQARIVYWFE